MSFCANEQYSDVDVSYLPTPDGGLKLSVLTDWHSRRRCRCGQSTNGAVLELNFMTPLAQMARLGGEMFLPIQA